MVRSILGLFAESPFEPLRELAHKVRDTTRELPALFDAVFEGDYERVQTKSEEISRLEHEADQVKDQVRDRLPKTIFLPVDRRDLLDVIALLDAVADYTEDVGIMVTMREMEPHEEIAEETQTLVERVLDVIDQAVDIIESLPSLIEAGFEGPEAQRVKEMIDELNRLEHEADVTQDEISRILFEIEDDIKPASLFMWNKIVNKLGDVANRAETMGSRLRLFIAQS